MGTERLFGIFLIVDIGDRFATLYPNPGLEQKMSRVKMRALVNMGSDVHSLLSGLSPQNRRYEK
jgi:hypothetical protein